MEPLALSANRALEELLDQSSLSHWAIGWQKEFQIVSRGCAALLHKTPAELLGRKLSEVLPPQSQAAWNDRIERVLAGESFSLIESIFDGTGPLYSISMFPIRSSEERIVAAAAIAQNLSVGDASEQLQATTLRMLQAQEATSARLGRFLHDEVAQSLSSAGLRLDLARLARFLHDEVAQALSSAGLRLDLLRMDLGEAIPEIGPRADEIQGLLENIMSRVREFSHALNPDLAERIGLHSALDRLPEQTRQSYSGTLRLLADSSLRIPPRVAAAMYRIAEEAVENAIRHADCSTVEVLVKLSQNSPTLEIRDNGKGFDADKVRSDRRGLGLLVMKHRAEEAGLCFTLITALGEGTVVRASCIAEESMRKGE